MSSSFASGFLETGDTELQAELLAAAGDKARILGISEDGLWWVIELPDYVAPDGRGWVSAGYVNAANADDVPVIATPPLP